MRTVALTLLLLTPASATAQTVVDPGVDSYDLDRDIGLLEDPSGSLTVDEVARRTFTPNDAPHASLGLSDSVFWVRIVLRNESSEPQARLLEIARATISHIALHYPDGTVKRTTRFTPYSEREVAARFPAFGVSLPPSSETTLYLRVASQSELFFPLRLWTPEAFHRHQETELLIIGASYGALFLLALYHFALFLRLRERHLLYFAGYCLLFDTWIWLVDGTGYGTFEHLLPALGYYPFVPTGLGAVGLAALFARRFLRTEGRAPWMHRALGAVPVAAVALTLIQPLFEHRVINGVSPVIWVLAHVGMLAAGIHAWRQGVRDAGWFVAAWTFYVASAIYGALAINGVVVWFSSETLNPFRLGGLLDAILMSFALANRLRELGRERGEARAFAAAQAQLAEAEKSAVLGRLMAGLLHEMNTPLGALRSASGSLAKTLERLGEALPDEVDAKKARRYLAAGAELTEVVGDSGARIEEVIESLKRFTALDEGTEKRVDVREGLQGALTLLAPDIGDRVEVALELPDAPAIVLCKPGPLNRVLLELLQRALDVSPEGGTVTVQVAVDDAVGIEIRDEGPPIPADELATLFDFGFAEADGRVRMRLALPLAMQVIKGMSGELVAESDASGTTITVTLPT